MEYVTSIEKFSPINHVSYQQNPSTLITYKDSPQMCYFSIADVLGAIIVSQQAIIYC